MEQSHADTIVHEHIACGTLGQKTLSFTNGQSHASKPKGVTYMCDCVTDGLQNRQVCASSPLSITDTVLWEAKAASRTRSVPQAMCSRCKVLYHSL